MDRRSKLKNDKRYDGKHLDASEWLEILISQMRIFYSIEDV